jgi:hypothetical protein
VGINPKIPPYKKINAMDVKNTKLGKYQLLIMKKLVLKQCMERGEINEFTHMVNWQLAQSSQIFTFPK